MRRSILSEKNLVVVLFIMVVVLFSFAQADTPRIEKLYFNTTPQVTTSADHLQSQKASLKVIDIKPVMSLVQLR